MQKMSIFIKAVSLDLKENEIPCIFISYSVSLFIYFLVYFSLNSIPPIVYCNIFFQLKVCTYLCIYFSQFYPSFNSSHRYFFQMKRGPHWMCTTYNICFFNWKYDLLQFSILSTYASFIKLHYVIDHYGRNLPIISKKY